MKAATRERDPSHRHKRETALLELAALDKSDFDDVLKRILRVDAEILHVERASFWSLRTDPAVAIVCEGNYLRSRATYESGAELLVHQYPRYFQALFADPVVCAHDARADVRTSEFADDYLEPLGITSMMDVPIWLRGALAGVLCHEHVGPARQWTADERRFAVAAGNILTMALQVREQLRAQETLKESEEHLRMLVEGMTDHAIFKLDAEGRIATWNAGARGIYGYTAAEAIGQSVSILYPRERVERGAPKQDLDEAASCATTECEGWRARCDGTRFWAGLVTTTLRDEHGYLRGFAQVTRNITQRKRQNLLAEASLALVSCLDCDVTLGYLTRVLIPFVADWCFVQLVEDDGKIRSSAALHENAAKQRLLVDAIEARNPDRPSLRFGRHAIHSGRPEVFPQVTAQDLDAICGDEEDKRIFLDLGLTSAMAVPLVIHPRSIGAICLASSMPGRKYSPADLTLVTELAGRTALAISNARRFQRSQDLLEERDEFISIAAHELRTPLTPLLLSLQSLRRLAATRPLDAEVKQKLDAALRGVNRLGRLVDGLLDVARMTAGDLQLELELLDLSAVVRDIVEQFREEAHEHGCDLKFRVHGATTGLWDGSRLQQIVVNLLSNAMKYGAGHPVDVTVEGNDKTVRLAVRDHGIGIAPQNLDRIFGRFERAAPVRSYGGLGLGLYITRQIVDAHGGRVWATSEAGSGTTFTVEMPRSLCTDMRKAQ